MARIRTALPHRLELVLLLAFGSSACNSLTKLDAYSVGTGTDTDENVVCQSNAQCTDQATAAAGSSTPVAAVCVQASGKCVELLSEDCDTITGDYLSDDA